ncbi:hypothetical protein GCM10010233_64500 [Streptomyces pseudogriseolus]|uniref:hypothetical protein n=1 Tax=Streptomyces pseudogriseolus TaxID=36817 RepID=UPI00167A6791|nr:hypothetical protein GCM10010233_64500 [Streptomyces gancidicus]
MTATQSAPARAAETDAEYEAYEKVVQIMSKAMSDSILKSLSKLKDQETFVAHVRDVADAQGIARDDVRAEDLFEPFWRLANGLDLEMEWRSSSGVPVRSALIADSIVPPDGQERFSLGVSAFGIGVGVSW